MVDLKLTDQESAALVFRLFIFMQKLNFVGGEGKNKDWKSCISFLQASISLPSL